MKVSVTLKEVLTYEHTKEVEMTKAEYNHYLKTGKLPEKTDTSLQHELSGEIDNEHWIETEHYIINVEKK